MAILNLDFYSYALGMDSFISVLLPEKRLHKPEINPDKKYPVLYLLHGATDDHTSYVRKSVIELLTRDHDLIVVMPSGHLSFYTNTTYGINYFDYITEELPLIVSNYFPASNKREDRYIAGLSMGGYGSLKAAFSRPDLYAGVASMSGAINVGFHKVKEQISRPSVIKNEEALFSGIFGSKENYTGKDHDIVSLVKELPNKKNGLDLKVYQCCGTEDFLYEQNTLLKSAIENIELKKYVYHEEPGLHNWAYWNKELPRILEYFGFRMNWEQLPL